MLPSPVLADGTDQKNIRQDVTGTINVIGNGGADTIALDRLGVDSVNNATVYDGADRIVIGAQVPRSEALVAYSS